MASSAFVIPVVAGIGNALMAVPLVRQLGRAVPGAKIVVLARTGTMGEVFQRLPEVREVRIMSRGSLGMFRSVRAAAALRPDAFLIPFPSNRWQYMALALASGARRRVLHSYPVGKWRTLNFLPASRLRAVRGLHDVLQNLYLLRLLGIEPDISERPEFILTTEDPSRAAELLASIALRPESRPIIIHAGSATTVLAQAKRWPPANYAQLIRGLRERYPHPVVIVEGPDEAGVGDEIATLAGSPAKVLRLRGSLSTTAALLKQAALYVGSDSGLAHLAAAVGTPPVTLFGPADPDRVSPCGYRHLVVSPRCDCCPSLLYPFQSTRPKLKQRESTCIRTIRPEDVLPLVAKALEPLPIRA